MEWHSGKMAPYTTAIMQVFNKLKVQTDSNVKALNAFLGQSYNAFTLSRHQMHQAFLPQDHQRAPWICLELCGRVTVRHPAR